jgi:hypothetical protein
MTEKQQNTFKNLTEMFRLAISCMTGVWSSRQVIKPPVLIPVFVFLKFINLNIDLRLQLLQNLTSNIVFKIKACSKSVNYVLTVSILLNANYPSIDTTANLSSTDNYGVVDADVILREILFQVFW